LLRGRLGNQLEGRRRKKMVGRWATAVSGTGPDLRLPGHGALIDAAVQFYGFRATFAHTDLVIATLRRATTVFAKATPGLPPGPDLTEQWSRRRWGTSGGAALHEAGVGAGCGRFLFPREVLGGLTGRTVEALTTARSLRRTARDRRRGRPVTALQAGPAYDPGSLRRGPASGHRLAEIRYGAALEGARDRDYGEDETALGIDSRVAWAASRLDGTRAFWPGGRSVGWGGPDCSLRSQWPLSPVGRTCHSTNGSRHRHGNMGRPDTDYDDGRELRHLQRRRPRETGGPVGLPARREFLGTRLTGRRGRGSSRRPRLDSGDHPRGRTVRGWVYMTKHGHYLASISRSSRPWTPGSVHRQADGDRSVFWNPRPQTNDISCPTRRPSRRFRRARPGRSRRGRVGARSHRAGISPDHVGHLGGLGRGGIRAIQVTSAKREMACRPRRGH